MRNSIIDSKGSLPRTRFGELTFGNCLTFTVDGEETFKLIYDELIKAKGCIYIANYDLDPRLRFVRDSSPSPRPNSSPHYLIRSPCTSGEASDNKDNNNDSGNNSNRKLAEETYSLQDLLIEKAKQGVEIKIIIWQPRLELRIIPGADERGLGGRTKEVEMMNELAKSNGIEQNLMVRIDNTAPTITSGHHDKIIVIDNQVGFCGGLDLSRGKWDTSDHDFDNSLREANAHPWHDVQAMVKGPVVWDLIYHFHQRWVYSQTKDVRQVRGMEIKSSFSNHGGDGNTSIIALRTWHKFNRNGGILAWYAGMFRKAKESIYIENQFPFENKFITQLLVKRLKQVKNLKVITVSPVDPNLPGFIGSIIAKASVNEIDENLKLLRKTGEDRVKTYSLISQHDSIKEKRKQIYVHSKVMIIDDKWITIGSANMDRDGFRDSSELDLGILAPTPARQLRVKLWREHLGGHNNKNTGDDIDNTIKDANLDSFDEGFRAWEKLADDNGKRALKNEAISGHVYYHNFEEMNLPPPYIGAKDDTKFKWI
jgi:phosphatidylserine/phosphatidylglycerophosphate/cardiolipin synthase-like enzyme